MRAVTRDWLENGDDHGFYLIESHNREAFYPAIIGLAKDMSHVAYSFEKLAECYMKLNSWTWDEAVEWIEFNVERSLPYYGEKAPVILLRNYLNSRNKYYEPIKIVEDENG